MRVLFAESREAAPELERDEHEARHQPGEQEVTRHAPEQVAGNLAVEKLRYGQIQAEARRHARKSGDEEISPTEQQKPCAHGRSLFLREPEHRAKGVEIAPSAAE